MVFLKLQLEVHMKSTNKPIGIFFIFILIVSAGMLNGAIPASERAALIALYNATNGDNWYYNDITRWPNHSIGVDKGDVQGHLIDTWNDWDVDRMYDHFTGEYVYLSCHLCEYHGTKYYNILGALLHIYACYSGIGVHTVVGDNDDLIQFMKDPATYGAMVMIWPSGEVPIW